MYEVPAGAGISYGRRARYRSVPLYPLEVMVPVTSPDRVNPSWLAKMEQVVVPLLLCLAVISVWL